MYAQNLATITLRDGRTLGFAERGPAAGLPILFFGGLAHDRAACLPPIKDVRLISVDRPGLGQSTRRDTPSIARFADDVEQLLDELDITRCAVLAWSAGGAYALACRAALGNRITAMTVAGGMSPPEATNGSRDVFARFMLQLAAISPHLIGAPLYVLRRQAQLNGESLMRILYSRSPYCDRAVLAHPEIRELFKATYKSATWPGVSGLIDEVTALARPWDVDLDAIDGRILRFIYGDRDQLTPARDGELLANRIGASSFQIVPGVGHMHLWVTWGELLEDLVARSIPIAWAA